MAARTREGRARATWRPEIAVPDDVTRALLDCVDDAIVVLSPDLRTRYANRAAARLAADGAADAPIEPAAIVHPDDLAIAADAIARAVDGEHAVVRLRLRLPTGERPVEVSLTNHLATAGVEGVVACFRNLEQEEALRTSLERLQQLDQHTTSLESILHERQALLRRLVRIQSSISSRSPLQDVMNAVATGAVDLFGSGSAVLRVTNPSTGEMLAAQAALRDRVPGARQEADPTSRWLHRDGPPSELASVIRYGTLPVGHLAVVAPIAPPFADAAREMLDVLAEHAGIALHGAGTRADVLVALTDHLTGLPSRRLLLERLERALRHCEEQCRTVSVFFVDLDGFKTINDSLGHTAGDAMLRSTTSRLLATWTEEEHWGRIGGDEFVLFVEGCESEQARVLAQQISDSLRQPMMLGGRSFYTSASVGYTVVDEPGISAEAAVRRADIAMYEGKRAGANGVTPFAPEMEQRVVVRTELEGQLRRALIGAGPNVVFQPIVDLRTGHTIAVEALARWNSPTQGSISPDRFVALAEQMGVVGQLDRHVLRKSCRAVTDRRDPTRGMLLDLTVNMSTLHLATEELADDVLRVVDDAGFDPSRLIVEVTESIAIEHDDILREQLQRLRARGVRVALDDFGTGHSSLAQLEKLAIDLVKVDRSFLDGVPGSERRLRYLETIIAMARALDLRVVFEGIETIEQVRVLSSLGVTLGQGYLLARPVDDDRLETSMVRAADLVRSTNDPVLL